MVVVASGPVDRADVLGDGVLVRGWGVVVVGGNGASIVTLLWWDGAVSRCHGGWGRAVDQR